MEKNYKLPRENESQKIGEPAVEYYKATELRPSPPLTEEELKDSMSTEEFKEYWFNCIDEIFRK